jgi:hypothetical protein
LNDVIKKPLKEIKGDVLEDGKDALLGVIADAFSVSR